MDKDIQTYMLPSLSASGARIRHDRRLSAVIMTGIALVRVTAISLQADAAMLMCRAVFRPPYSPLVLALISLTETTDEPWADLNLPVEYHGEQAVVVACAYLPEFPLEAKE